MAVIYYGDNQWQPNYYYPFDGEYTSPEVTVNYTVYMTCPHCQGYINDYIGFHYCPYCGKELFPVKDIKPEILERLDKMLKEIKEIKEELEKE